MSEQTKNNLEARLEDLLPEKRLGLNRKYDTIAHKFLDIEAEVDFGNVNYNVFDSDYQVIDNLIDDAQKRINKIKPDKHFTEYNEEEAITVLEIISDVIDDGGFEYRSNDLFNCGLKNKKMDCKHYSTIYLGIADALGLPLRAVNVPRHIFVRWHFDDNKYFNWETVQAEKRADDHYKFGHNVFNESIEKGVYLKSLTKKELCFTAYHSRGMVLHLIGRYEESVSNYDKAFLFDPFYPIVHANKGAALHCLGRYEEAIENYDEAIRLDPFCPSAHSNKGLALHSLGRYEEAIENYDEAIKLNPSYHFAYANKGLTLHCLKRYDEAIENYKQALKINPKYDFARDNLKLALKKIKKPKNN